jgi:hypothetical protein
MQICYPNRATKWTLASPFGLPRKRAFGEKGWCRVSVESVKEGRVEGQDTFFLHCKSKLQAGERIREREGESFRWRQGWVHVVLIERRGEPDGR